MVHMYKNMEEICVYTTLLPNHFDLTSSEPFWEHVHLHIHIEEFKEGDLKKTLACRHYRGSLVNLCLVFLFRVANKYKLRLVPYNSECAYVSSFDVISYGFRKVGLDGCLAHAPTSFWLRNGGKSFFRFDFHLIQGKTIFFYYQFYVEPMVFQLLCWTHCQ